MVTSSCDDPDRASALGRALKIPYMRIRLQRPMKPSDHRSRAGSSRRWWSWTWFNRRQWGSRPAIA